MKYINFRKGLVSKPNLIPISSNPYDHIDDQSKDYYVSLFQYDEHHKDILKEKGTLAGIKDVQTDILYFDFDSKDDIELARDDTLELCNRLQLKGINEYTICFSGCKGFSVEVYSNELLNVDEFKATINSLAGDLKTFDTSVSDPQRIVRLPNTRHQKTPFFKVPLTRFDLETMHVEEIQHVAGKQNFDGYSPVYIDLPKGIKQSVVPKTETKEATKTLDMSGFDIKSRPAQFDEARWLINNGFFESGERSNALLCLASFYKSLGYLEEQTYRILKGTAELQSKRSGDDRFPDNELYNNIIVQVYGANWKGGIYSIHDENSWLYKYATKKGLNLKDSVMDKPSKILDIQKQFTDFVNNIDKNTIKTGIKRLDDSLQITTGMCLGLVGAPSSGKCLGFDTPVRMFDGSVKMVQDIKTGELLMGDDSTPRTVLSTCKGRSKLYNVDQENGDSYVINDVHILSLKTNENKGKYQKGDVIDIEVGEFLKKSKDFSRHFKGYKVAVEYPEKQLPIDPYFLGLWLGDGSSSKPEITSVDQEIKDYCISFCEKHGMDFKPQSSTKENEITFRMGGNRQEQKPFLLDFLRDWNLLDNKHIPNDFLINSRENRLRLLAGIIDTDGHCNTALDGKQTSYDVVQKNETLSNNIVELARSLGFKATIYKEQKGCTYKGERRIGWYYRIYINGNNLHEIPVLLPRKKMEKREKVKDISLGRLTITDIGEGDYYGFELDGNRRFLLGDFTVTHNTAIALDILANTSKQGVTSVFASLDMYRTRIFEKINYRVSGGKSREEIYKMYQSGREKELTKKIDEEFGNVYFYDRSSPTVQNIRDYVLHVEQTSGEKVKLVLIDYFERVSSDMNDDTAASKRVSAELQDMMNDLNVCVIILYQPNKMSIGGGPDTPILNYTAIKGSSFVFQSLRNIISIWRPFQTPHTKDIDKYMSLAILKSDLGELDVFDFGWVGKTGKIYELEDHERQELRDLLKQKEAMKKEKENGGWN